MAQKYETKSGTIYPWHETIEMIPEGYNLCDGSRGTPDLRNYKPPVDGSPRPSYKPQHHIQKS